MYCALFFSSNIAIHFPDFVNFISSSNFNEIKTKPVKTFSKMKDINKTNSNSKQEPKTTMDNFEIIRSSANGNCLFHCVLQVLQSIGFEKETIGHLRKIVSESVTEEQFNDLKLIQSAVVDYNCLNKADTLEDFRNLILTSRWWGEQVTLKILKNYCKINFIVLRDETNEKGQRSLVYQKQDSSEAETYDLFALLILKHQHFELAMYKKKTVLRREELPPKLLTLLDHFSSTTDNDHTSLQIHTFNNIS